MSPIRSLRFTLVAACAAMTLASPLHAAVLQDGEMLQYKVRYGMFRLGTVQIRTLRDSTHPDRFRLLFLEQSASGIPFITVHEYNESWINAVSFFSEGFYGKHENSGEHEIIREVVDRPRATVFYSVEDLNTNAFTQRDTLRNAPEYAEGPTLLFRARQFASRGGTMRVPTLARGRIFNTTVSYTPATEDIDVPCVNAPVHARRFQTHADGATTSNGLSVDFTAWLSDDDAAVPLRTEMQLALGSITLELEKWSRAGWTPPTSSVSTR